MKHIEENVSSIKVTLDVLAVVQQLGINATDWPKELPPLSTNSPKTSKP
jgi:hypothetical protein